MKHITLTAISIFTISVCAFAQFPPPDTMWTGLYTYGYQAFGYSVEQTDDGGFIACGTTHIGFVQHPYLIKTDGNGNLEWERTYPAEVGAGLYEVHQLRNGGYITAGYLIDYSGDGQNYLIKTDSFGDTLWTKIYGTEESNDAFSVQETLDGGYIVAGFLHFTPSNLAYIHLLKTNSDGDSLWMKIYDHTYGRVESVIENSDGDYLMAGHAWIEGASWVDPILIKTDQNGDTIWTRLYGGEYSDAFRSVKQTSDGGYILTGNSGTDTGDYDFYLVKTDSEGDTLWTRTYGGDEDEVGYCVDQTHDGGYIITGRTSSYGFGNRDLYVVRTDEIGDTLWTTTFGGDDYDWGRSIQQTDDGGFIICGDTKSFGTGEVHNLWLIRLEAENFPVIRDLMINISGLDVILRWREMNLAEEYRIYRSDTPYFEVTGMTPISVQTENSFVDPGAAGGRYFYRVTVVY